VDTHITIIQKLTTIGCDMTITHRQSRQIGIFLCRLERRWSIYWTICKTISSII